MDGISQAPSQIPLGRETLLAQSGLHYRRVHLPDMEDGYGIRELVRRTAACGKLPAQRQEVIQLTYAPS